ncbi:MAG: UDP-2,3-diacylglucosamine diphosphatase LpxI [Rhodospirillaceae bacterium]|nr:UDP-2,3-diacylglucosamine diphosphatase LpxI [Rhodospirillaceae bacterium]
MEAPPPARLGLIAGAGALPGLIAAAARGQGRPCFVLGVEGFADPAQLGAGPDAWVDFNHAARGFALLRAAGVRDLVMAGRVRRPRLAEFRPDLRTAAFLARVAYHALGDDGLLRAVTAEIEREGFRVVGVGDVLAEALAPVGLIGGPAPGDPARADIALGFAAARALGRADVGQAVAVAGGRVLAREDAAGTDAMIAAVGAAEQGARPILVKCKKPTQDRRVDLPAIGPDTVTNCAQAGFAGIAVEAGETIVIDRAAVARAADAAGLFVVGVSLAETPS